MPDNQEINVIESAGGLSALLRKLGEAPAIAVDVEADSMYHFQEKVCLIQTATRERIALIDPLRVPDLTPLQSIFTARATQKVLHGADYDVRCLYRDFRFKINNLFDTELACRFLGIRNTGLEAVLQERFGVVLNKKFQRKDWSRRPLPAEMIAYGADDVRYLLPLAEVLERELKARGRLEWVREECDLLCSARPAMNDREPLFLHFRGAGRLDPRSLAVLETLLQYRRETARRKDRPLFKVFSNKALLHLAVEKPVSLVQLAQSDTISGKQLKMYGEELLEVIRQALALPREGLPVYPRKKPISVPPAVPDRIRALKTWRDRKARKLGLEPGLLINKSLMTALAIARPRGPEELEGLADLKNWQKQVLGREIVAVLHNVK
jgi:ribonuclease D